MSSPFHRLLTFFATRSSPSSRTITFLDSLRGDLSVGLNFPVAFFLAATRHLIFGNTGTLSLTIDVPNVKTSRVLLGGPHRFDVDESRRYGLWDLLAITAGGGLVSRFDAVGCWGLVAERDGKVSGHDFRAFQSGEVMDVVARRRQGRADVLPFWRGGPIWVDGHSWMVKKLFDVDVYQRDSKTD